MGIILGCQTDESVLGRMPTTAVRPHWRPGIGIGEVSVTAFCEETGKFSTAAAGSELLPPLGRSEGSCKL